MKRISRRSIGAGFELLFAAVLFFIHYTQGFKLTVHRAEPMILLPFLIAYSMHREELHSAIAGALVGFFSDSVSSGTGFFHTLLFFTVCCTVSFTMKYLLNNNIRTAVMLSILSALLYYLLRWLRFFAFTGAENSITYLMRYALPSVIYTAVFIVPFYYLQRLIARFREKGEVK